MSLAETHIRAALVNALSNDASLTTLLGAGRIHDTPPRGAKLPFIAFGPIVSSVQEADGGGVEEHVFEVDIWGRQGGRAEVETIAASVEVVLSDTSWNLEHHRIVSMNLTSRRSLSEANRKSFRTQLRFRIVSEAIESS